MIRFFKNKLESVRKKKKIAMMLINCSQAQFLRIRPVCLKLHAKAMFFYRVQLIFRLVIMLMKFPFCLGNVQTN